MKRALLGLLLTGCVTEEEQHFREVAEIMCHYEAECRPEYFDAAYPDVEECVDEAEIGVAIYAERCEGFDPYWASRCRMHLRKRGALCNVDPDDRIYASLCLRMCSNYAAAAPE